MLEQTFRRSGVGSDVLVNDNEVDAYGLARMGASYLKWLKGNVNFAKYEMESFAKLGGKCTL